MAFNNSSCHYQDGLKVLFDGSKHFWRTRTNIDVVALHTNHNCIEIVCFNPTLALKAPRIYVNFSALKSHLDPSEINERLRQMHADAKKQKRTLVVKDATAKILNQLSLDFLFQRLNIAEGSTAGNFRMVLHPRSGDRGVPFDGQMTLDCVVICPQLLIPVTVDHKATLNKSDVERVMHQFNGEQLQLHQATRFANLLISSTDGFQQVLKLRKEQLKNSSKARQRWILAFNRLVTMNYIRKAEERILCSEQAGWYHRLQLFNRMDSEAAEKAGEDSDKKKQTQPQAPKKSQVHPYRQVKPTGGRVRGVGEKEAEKRQKASLQAAAHAVKVANALVRVKKNAPRVIEEDGDTLPPIDAHLNKHAVLQNEDLTIEDADDDEPLVRDAAKLLPIGNEKTNKKIFYEHGADLERVERERALYYYHCNKGFKGRMGVEHYHRAIESEPFFQRENAQKRELDHHFIADLDHEVHTGGMFDSHPDRESTIIDSSTHTTHSLHQPQDLHCSHSSHSHSHSSSQLDASEQPPSLLEEFSKSIVKLDQNVRLERFTEPEEQAMIKFREQLERQRHHVHRTQHVTTEQYEEMRKNRGHHHHSTHRSDQGNDLHGYTKAFFLFYGYSKPEVDGSKQYHHNRRNQRKKHDEDSVEHHNDNNPKNHDSRAQNSHSPTHHFYYRGNNDPSHNHDQGENHQYGHHAAVNNGVKSPQKQHIHLHGLPAKERIMLMMNDDDHEERVVTGQSPATTHRFDARL